MQQIYATLVSLVAVAKTAPSEEKGATAVEYGLLVGLIAVAIIVDRRPARHAAERPVQDASRTPCPAGRRADPHSYHSRLFGAAVPGQGGRCAAAHRKAVTSS